MSVVPLYAGRFVFSTSSFAGAPATLVLNRDTLLDFFTISHSVLHQGPKIDVGPVGSNGCLLATSASSVL